MFDLWLIFLWVPSKLPISETTHRQNGQGRVRTNLNRNCRRLHMCVLWQIGSLHSWCCRHVLQRRLWSGRVTTRKGHAKFWALGQFWHGMTSIWKSQRKNLNGLPKSLFVHIAYHMEGKVKVSYVLNLSEPFLGFPNKEAPAWRSLKFLILNNSTSLMCYFRRSLLKGPHYFPVAPWASIQNYFPKWRPKGEMTY